MNKDWWRKFLLFLGYKGFSIEQTFFGNKLHSQNEHLRGLYDEKKSIDAVQTVISHKMTDDG